MLATADKIDIATDKLKIAVVEMLEVAKSAELDAVLAARSTRS